jgi:hypothetical protein
MMQKLPITWEEVAQICRIDPNQLPDLTNVAEDDKKMRIAQYKKPFIVKAINGPEFKADYSNWNQYKWFPVFVWDKQKSAFVFATSGCELTITYAGCGPRFAFESEEKADHAAKYFYDVFIDEMM